MKEMDIKKMITRGQWGTTLHLNRQHGLDQLQANDIDLFCRIVTEKYFFIKDLALEDLCVTDTEALALADLIGTLPLTDFALQGEKLGDNCVVALLTALLKRNLQQERSVTASSLLAFAEANPSPYFKNSKLQSLQLGGNAFTDECLPLLTHILLNNPTITYFSMNWSSHFSESGTWQMAATLFAQNLSLTGSSCYGFFQNKDQKSPDYAYLINTTLGLMVARNNHLRTVPEANRYLIYKEIVHNYNWMFKKMFQEAKVVYGLQEAFFTRYLCKPMEEEDFIHRYDHKIPLEDSDRISVNNSHEWLTLLSDIFSGRNMGSINNTLSSMQIIENYYSIASACKHSKSSSLINANFLARSRYSQDDILKKMEKAPVKDMKLLVSSTFNCGNYLISVFEKKSSGIPRLNSAMKSNL